MQTTDPWEQVKLPTTEQLDFLMSGYEINLHQIPMSLFINQLAVRTHVYGENYCVNYFVTLCGTHRICTNTCLIKYVLHSKHILLDSLKEWF